MGLQACQVRHLLTGLLLSAVLTLAALAVTSCNSDTDKPYWGVDEYGWFSTRDEQRAKEEIPFLILPSYLPADLDLYPYRHPSILGPLYDAVPDGERRIQIDYIRFYEPQGLSRIRIEECDWTIHPPDPAFNPDLEHVEIAGIQVTAISDVQGVLSNSGRSPVPGYEFWWMKNDISFVVGVYGYDYDEAERVVESMIVQ